ncbi:MAG TPA: hypothetical protein VFB69_08440 [Candidatus Dormibacteraeota bacterium]|nr:hypothetical protein [Candidatus Dormibacteraeota bacterium]
MTVGRRPIPGGAVEIAGRVVARLGLPVAKPGRDIAILRRKAGLPAAHPAQLVGPGILAVLGGLRAVFGRNLAVIDGLSAVVGSIKSPRRRRAALARGSTLAFGAVTGRSVEVTRSVIARGGLSITLLRLAVPHVGGQVPVATFEVTLSGLGEGVVAIIEPGWVQIWRLHIAGSYFGHMGSPGH